MAKQQTRYSDFVTEWEHLTASVAASNGEIPHLEAPRQKLQAFLEEVRTLSLQQDQLAAQKQQVSQRLSALLRDGKKLATFVRTGLKEHYGNRSEELVKFGVQPFRRRTRVAKPEGPPKPDPQEPEVPAPQ